MPATSRLSFEQAAKLSVVVLITIELLFVAINLVHYMVDFRFGIIHLWFYLDNERTVPAWFSASQLFLIGTVFIVTANLTPLSGRSRLFFLFCGLGCIFLSMDESISIHETVGRTLERFQAFPNPLGGHSQFIWAYPLLGALVLLVNLRAVAECLAKERRASLTCAAGAAVFVAGGAGIELIGHGISEKGFANLEYLLQVCVEEFLEMLGCTLLLYGALLFLQSGLTADTGKVTAAT